MNYTNTVNAYFTDKDLQVDLLIRLVLALLLVISTLWFHYLTDVYREWLSAHKGGRDAIHSIRDTKYALSYYPFILSGLLLFSPKQYRNVFMTLFIIMMIFNVGKKYNEDGGYRYKHNTAYVATTATAVTSLSFQPTDAAKIGVQLANDIPVMMEKATLMIQEMNIGAAKALGLKAERRSYEDIKVDIDRNEGVKKATSIARQSSLPITYEE